MINNKMFENFNGEIGAQIRSWWLHIEKFGFQNLTNSPEENVDSDSVLESNKTSNFVGDTFFNGENKNFS